MDKFTYSYLYPKKVYFGEGVAADVLKQELPKVGKTVMLAYGKGSVKKNGIYDELKNLLLQANKEIVNFDRIMPNSTDTKVWAKERHVDFILAVGGGSVVDCCTVIPPRLWQKKISGAWNMNEENFLQWAVVTLSGTGAEMNPGAVITYEEKLWKRPIVVCRSRSCLYCNGSAGQISVWLEELGLNFDHFQTMETVEHREESGGFGYEISTYGNESLAKDMEY